MPGMMDTVLNLGLNDAVVEGLAAKANPRFAYDAYRRFLDMFGDVVMGVPHAAFEEQLEGIKVKGVDGSEGGELCGLNFGVEGSAGISGFQTYPQPPEKGCPAAYGDMLKRCKTDAGAPANVNNFCKSLMF